MIKVKTLNGRWRWLEFYENQDFIYFTDRAVERILEMIIERPIEENKIYEVDEVTGKFYGQNHGPKCSGLWPDIKCFECGGKGVLGSIQ